MADKTGSIRSSTESMEPTISSHTAIPMRGFLKILAATLLWSTTAIFIQPLVTTHGLTPLDISAWRAFLATPALGLFLLLRGRASFRITRAEIGYYAAAGAIGVALFNVLWGSSVQVNHAAVATALFYCSPAFVVVAARFLFAEHLGPLQVGAVGLSFVGCALVAGLNHPASLLRNPHGLELGIASGAAFAAYTLFGRGAAQRWSRDSLTVLFYVFLFAALVLLLTGLPIEGTRLLRLHTDTTGWLLLIGLTFGPSLGGYALFTAGLSQVPAGIASLFLTLEPPLTAILAAVILGKTLVGVQWWGTALIVSGVLVVQVDQLRTRRLVAEVIPL